MLTQEDLDTYSIATFEGFLNECENKNLTILHNVPLHLHKCNYTKSDITELYQQYHNYCDNRIGLATHFSVLYGLLQPNIETFTRRLSTNQYSFKDSIIHVLRLKCPVSYVLTQKDNDFIKEICTTYNYTERCRYTDFDNRQCVEFNLHDNMTPSPQRINESWSIHKKMISAFNPVSFESFLKDCSKRNITYRRYVDKNVWGKPVYEKSDVSSLYETYQALYNISPDFYTCYDMLYEWLTPKPDIFWNKLVDLAERIQADVDEDVTHAFILTLNPDTELSKEDSRYLEDACIVCGFMKRCSYVDQYRCRCYEFVCKENEEVTDLVYDKEDHYVWHLCRKDIYDRKISKTGLIPKTKCKRGRYYAPRIYVFINKPDKRNILSSIKQFIQSSIDITDTTLPLYNDWCLLKIDLSKGPKYRFFNDPEYGFIKNAAAFTYENIHPDSISLDSEFSVNAAEIFSNKISTIQK